jgi:hypothetical protein
VATVENKYYVNNYVLITPWMSNIKKKLQNLSKYTEAFFYACLFYAPLFYAVFALTALANLKPSLNFLSLIFNLTPFSWCLAFI